tara:strand:- start:802 stop:1140 length:339 start_codon:yes stop_codon:yes gene_type:complete
MEVTELSKQAHNVFKKRGHLLAPIKPREWVHQPDQFRLAIRCCDGTYHVVNSDIADIVRGGITRTEVKLAINALAPMDPIHGQRFVIFERNPTGEAYLLGPVENAIMMLAGA